MCVYIYKKNKNRKLENRITLNEFCFMLLPTIVCMSLYWVLLFYSNDAQSNYCFEF